MRNVLKFELFASKEPSIFAEVLGGKSANEPHMVIGNLTNFLCIMLQGFFFQKKILVMVLPCNTLFCYK